MTMPSIDPKTPPYLFSIQKWFAGVITQPIDNENRMNPIAPSGRLISEEAKEFISPSAKLSSDERIQIYNQQYWWRLLTILHEHFPTIVRLFGYADFNLSIGMPFITKYPSHHWSLAQLGDQLSVWIDEYYTAKDKPLVFHSAEIDWAYQALFLAPPPFFLPPSLELVSKKLALQSHVRLFNLPFDLFSFRAALLKEEVEYWLDADFPVLPKDKKYFFILYRTQKNQILYKEIQEGQWILLDLISKGFSIEEACDNLEKIGGKASDEAEASLQQWIQEWINERWIIPLK